MSMLLFVEISTNMETIQMNWIHVIAHQQLQLMHSSILNSFGNAIHLECGLFFVCVRLCHFTFSCNYHQTARHFTLIFLLTTAEDRKEKIIANICLLVQISIKHDFDVNCGICAFAKSNRKHTQKQWYTFPCGCGGDCHFIFVDFCCCFRLTNSQS